MYPKRRGLCGILILAASLTVLGCGSSGNSNVRAVNASPGFAPFTYQVAQIGVASSPPYGTEGVQPQGDYTTSDTSGNYRFVGAGANQSLLTYVTQGTPLTSVQQSFLKGTYYTIVSLGSAPNMALMTLTDDDSAPQSGDYKLRFMDASGTAGPVDVYITAAGVGGTGGTNATPIIGNIQFRQVTSYLQLSPGTLQVQVTQQGNPSNVLLTAAFSPAGANIYSLFLLDPANSGTGAYGLLVVHDPVSAASTMGSGT